MTRAEFKEWLKDEVTLSGALAIDIPDKEYDRVIDRGLKMLYQINPDALKESYCIIPCEYFYTPEFRKNRIIQFPECVMSINRFVEMKQRNIMFGANDPDFSFNRAFMADMWLGSQMNMDTVMFRTIQMSTWDQLKRFTLIDIKHRWSEADHSLLVLGHDPRVNVFVGLHVKVDDSELFDNIWCQKWIAAHMKLRACTLLGLFTTNLIGGVTINTGTISDEANKDIEDCKNYFKEANTISWFRTIP